MYGCRGLTAGHERAGNRTTVALWLWSVRHDLLNVAGVKLAVAWYCIVVGVLLAGVVGE